jgi:tetratricopeptide (TPR) repeat protein
LETPTAFGPFEVRGELGRGSGGVAYMAWHPDDDRTVAVKLYSTAPRDATGTIGRVKRDAQAAGALGHPNIAAVLGVGEHDGCPWVATEFVPGVSLAQVMRGRALLPIERVLDVWRQMCEGLAHAHREGVLHLDLKPSDVRLAPSGEVKLLDFGSWHVKALEPGVPGRIDGGLHYRAPELLIGRRPDRRADVFSVAAIVYELVAYRKAFPGESTTDVVRLLSRCEPDLACLPRSPFTPGFERVLAASLARSPEARHSAFEEVHADLVQLVRETAPRLRPPSDSGEAGPPEREELLANVTRARAEDRLEDALEGCRLLLDRDSEDEAARRAMSEIEAVLVEREVDALVGMALASAADGDIALATGIAEKVERLAPWSPRYLQLQVYLDEEAARRQADTLVARAREHLAAGRVQDARDHANEATLVMPGHPQAQRLVDELGSAPAPVPVPAAAPVPEPAPPDPTEMPTAEMPAVELAAVELAVAVVAAHAEPPAASEAVQTAVVSAPPEPAPAEPEEPARAVETAGPSAAIEVEPPAAAPPAVAQAARAKPQDPRLAEAVTLSAAALHHFLKDDHVKAKAVVERALELDPGNRRAIELLKILRVLG